MNEIVCRRYPFLLPLNINMGPLGILRRRRVGPLFRICTNADVYQHRLLPVAWWRFIVHAIRVSFSLVLGPI